MASRSVALVFLLLSSLAGCAAPSDPSVGALADEIVDAPGATGDGFGDPQRAVNGVRGAGYLAGSTDVYSLDYARRPYVVLGWSGRVVTNGPGADLVVFENPFRTMWDPDQYFMDPIVVEVSRDGTTWVPLPHAYVASDPSAYSRHPADWEGFAGVLPVIVNDDTHPMSYFDPLAGGDAFDLDELAVDGEAGAIRAGGFRYVRLTSAALVIDPRTGQDYPRDMLSNGADVDGVAARWLASDPRPH
jgi:hypothetical protein